MGAAAARPESMAEASSFRDPAGHVVVHLDHVVRYVHLEHRAAITTFLQSEPGQKRLADGDVVATRRISADDTDDGPWLAHDRLPFISLPQEWPSEMLAAAGRLTLGLATDAHRLGLRLKDATPSNVLFVGPKPVFVDVASFEARDPHDPTWPPYDQFVRTFLLPLTMEAARGRSHQPAHGAFRGGDTGMAPEEAHALAGPLQRWRRPLRGAATLPTLLGRLVKDDDRAYTPRRVKDAEQARFVADGLVRRLGRDLARVRPTETASHWTDYRTNDDHYNDEASSDKDRFVADALHAVGPAKVLDLGCNTGRFAFQAAEHGASVVAVDQDPASVGAVWQQAHQRGLDVLPLVVDLARPTPAGGWRNRQWPSFLERARGWADLVLALAVVHHLAVTERVPFAEIVDLLAELTRSHVVVEAIGPGDPMVKRIARGRDALHAHQTIDAFVEACQERFELRRRVDLPGMDRALLLLELR